MEGLRVREAAAGDLDALAALRTSVGWGSGGLEGSLQAAAAGRQVILLAEVGGHLVGAVTGNFGPRPGGGPRTGHISDLLVAPLWRRRGIGARLLALAEEALRRRGMTAVTLDVDAHNEAAIQLYVRAGYRVVRPAQFPWGPGHTMRKQLVPPAPRGGADEDPGSRGLWNLLRRRAAER